MYDISQEKDSCGVGFIANIKGVKSHQIVGDAIRILCNLEHRGAVGADPRAGDGAGILVQIPHRFFARQAKELGFTLPEPGQYAIGALFMPRDTAWRQVIQSIIADQIKEEGLSLLGWRKVPTDNSSLGETVKPTEPVAYAGVHRPRRSLQERRRVRAPALCAAQVDLRTRSISVATAASPATIRCRCRAAP
ncbi:MAG: hypothetical protein MZV49_16460 [Rhodopseudomonas palustris]|nr:hypothetical protein [Rhodopseudomonas palustris]